MSCKYLIFGKGFIGNVLNNKLEKSVLSDKIIDSEQDVLEEIKIYEPEIIINCIGKTGNSNIDWCEDHKLETFQSNVLSPISIAKACSKSGIRMIHLGSGGIYNGDNKGIGFSEEDEPNFFGNFHALTKIMAERILNEFDNVLQLRINMLISSDRHQRNFLHRLLGYKNIINDTNSITVVEDMIQIIEILTEKNQSGIFNLVNDGVISNKEILEMIEEITGKNLSYEIIDDPKKVIKSGRSSSNLIAKRLKSLGIRIPGSRDSIRKCIIKYFNEEEVISR